MQYCHDIRFHINLCVHKLIWNLMYPYELPVLKKKAATHILFLLYNKLEQQRLLIMYLIV